MAAEQEDDVDDTIGEDPDEDDASNVLDVSSLRTDEVGDGPIQLPEQLKLEQFMAYVAKREARDQADLAVDKARLNTTNAKDAVIAACISEICDIDNPLPTTKSAAYMCQKEAIVAMLNFIVRPGSVAVPSREEGWKDTQAMKRSYGSMHFLSHIGGEDLPQTASLLKINLDVLIDTLLNIFLPTSSGYYLHAQVVISHLLTIDRVNTTRLILDKLVSGFPFCWIPLTSTGFQQTPLFCRFFPSSAMLGCSNLSPTFLEIFASTNRMFAVLLLLLYSYVTMMQPAMQRGHHGHAHDHQQQAEVLKLFRAPFILRVAQLVASSGVVLPRMRILAQPC